MIEVKNLIYKYPKNSSPTVKDISFKIEKGEIFGFLGPSGAGKSTTQKILIKLLLDYSGTINILGNDLINSNNDFYQNIGVCFELPNHYLKLSAIENLQFFTSFYKNINSNLMEFLDKVGLAAVDHDPGTELMVTADGRLRLCSDITGTLVSETSSSDVARGPAGSYLKGRPQSSVTFDILLGDDGAGSDNALIAVVLDEIEGKPDPEGSPMRPSAEKPGDRSCGIVVQGKRVGSDEWIDLTTVVPRENRSSTLLDEGVLRCPVSELAQLRLVWLSEHRVGNVRLVELVDCPVEARELKVAGAYHSVYGAMLNNLSVDDGRYVELSPGEKISLRFKDEAGVSAVLKRDFVLIAKGFYVNEKEAEEIRNRLAPREYFLAHNVPNPFNPVTQISYGLPKTSQVSLRIFDVQGRLVKTLVDVEQRGGYYNVAWDGRNDVGRSVASGVYFYRLQAGEFEKTNKMLLVK